MNLFTRFRQRASAPVARERLVILLSHDRAARSQQRDLLAVLREEILATVARHVTMDGNSVHVQMERGATAATLEIEVEIPHAVMPSPATAA